MNLSEELDELRAEKEPHLRGKKFETFIAHLLEDEGFDVTYDAKSASPRQTDLSARKESVFFIVEVKWTRRGAGIDVASSVRDRLTRVPPDVFACVFSMTGFSDESIADVGSRRDREIILFNGNEIDAIVTGRLSFSALLAEKRNALRTDAAVLLSEDQIPAPPKMHLRTASDFFKIGTQKHDWMRSDTQHIDFVFSNELLDCMGRRGDSLFSLELDLGIRKSDDLHRVLGLLKRYLGLSGQGSFAIHQGRVGWFGFGFQSFLSAVRNQSERYNELKWDHYHHSEELAYVDRLDFGGLMCLSSRQSVGQGDYLHSTRVEIYFPGIPVEISAIQELCKRTENSEAQLETIKRNPFKMLRFQTGLKVEPVAVIVSNTGDGKYASGLVVRNPFLNQTVPSDEDYSVRDLQRIMSGSELLFCALRNWHQPEIQMDRYELRSAEGCWIEHYYAMHLVCDWTS
jgi:Restriction endonuclease